MRELNEDRLIENITKRAYEDIRQHNVGGSGAATAANFEQDVCNSFQ